MKLSVLGVAVVVTAVSVRIGAGAQQANACERLASVALPNATVTSVTRVDAGTFSPPAGRRGSAEPFKDLGAFCRITTTTRMSTGTDAKMEIWLPAQNWTHDYQPAGGGFFGAGMPYGRMREILRTGSATSGSDSGIAGGGPGVLTQQPELMKNIANAPFHAMIGQSKALVAAYYGAAPQFTLMDECGNGGSRDALAIVQRWPNDLDVATAIGSTNYGTHHGLAQMWLYWATHKNDGSYIPEEKYAAIHQAALDACDAKDGVKDGIIEDPPHCTFDPGVLLCKGGDSPSCLTPPQADAVRTIYETPRHARTKAVLYGPMVPGSEFSWPDMTARPRPYAYAEQFYRFFVFHDPNWDYKTFTPDFAADVDRADSPENLAMNATDPNIAPFIDHGGKLIMMGGWNDDLGPGNNVNYYESVVRSIGAAKARLGVRLFMVPGMHHCLGLDYPSTYRVDFDLPSAAKHWKQTGSAPDEIVVTTTRAGQPPRRRLVCAYPKVSHYQGKGDTADPTNFVCKNPK
ncbi:MAG TPA: tannase/feruloyl esterase family alpha/beta hydrolase [Vicinamibacterales bacterium]|nr:tannase/feruloyl esterase family alpha/beta hydrolase [Vicinamibacterales bacterium]